MAIQSFIFSLLIFTTAITACFAQPPRPVGIGSEFLTALPPPPGGRPFAAVPQVPIVRRSPAPRPSRAPPLLLPKPTPVSVPDLLEAEPTVLPTIPPFVEPTPPPKSRRPKRFRYQFFYSPRAYFSYIYGRRHSATSRDD